MTFLKKSSSSFSSRIAIIFFNLTPILGVIFLQWNAYDLIFIYFMEFVFFVIFGSVRLRKTEGSGSLPTLLKDSYGKHANDKWKVVNHYYLFYGKVILIYGLILSYFFFILSNNEISIELLIVTAGLFVSHLISYKTNYIGRKEYERARIKELYHAPLKRMVAFHVTFFVIIILTAFISFFGIEEIEYLQSLLIIYLVVKTVFDLYLHNNEHQKLVPIDK